MSVQDFNSLFTRKQIEKILFYEIRFSLLLKIIPFLSKNMNQDDDMSVNYFDSFTKKNNILYKKKPHMAINELVENEVYSSYQEAMNQKNQEIEQFLNTDELIVDFQDTYFLIFQHPDLKLLNYQFAKRYKEQQESITQTAKEKHIKESSLLVKAHKKEIDLFKNNSMRWFLKYLQKSSLKIDTTLKKDLLKIFYLSFDIILDDFTTGNYILKNNITLIDDYVFSKYQHDNKLSTNFQKLIEIAKLKRFSDNVKENLLTYYVLIEELNFEIMFLLKDFYNYLLAIQYKNEVVINQYAYIIKEGQLAFYVSGINKQLKRKIEKAEVSQTYIHVDNLETILEKKQ